MADKYSRKEKIAVYLKVSQSYKGNTWVLQKESFTVQEKFILVKGLTLGPAPVRGARFITHASRLLSDDNLIYDLKRNPEYCK